MYNYDITFFFSHLFRNVAVYIQLQYNNFTFIQLCNTIFWSFSHHTHVIAHTLAHTRSHTIMILPATPPYSVRCCIKILLSFSFYWNMKSVIVNKQIHNQNTCILNDIRTVQEYYICRKTAKFHWSEKKKLFSVYCVISNNFTGPTQLD